MTSELIDRLRIEDARYPGDTLYGAAADEIERLTAQLAEARAEIERAKLEGVRAGIEAAANAVHHSLYAIGRIRALNAAAIAKEATRAAALSDLIAGDADLIDVPDTLGDSDGDDGA